MTLDTWILYVGTVLLFMLVPGPSHLLMLSVSLSNGFDRALATAAGDLTANLLQMLLAAFGLAAVIAASRYGFLLIKWAGVAYLVWIGIRQIIASFRRQPGSLTRDRVSRRRLWMRGFVTSAANPKAVVFFAALFPQFLDPTAALLPQLAVLGVSYLLIDGAFLLAYGSAASRVSAWLGGGLRPAVERVAGGALVGAALLLGARPVPESN